jgi:predicted RNA-binding Zn-ribbon protein involved in translation (DUF1610 family)
VTCEEEIGPTLGEEGLTIVERKGLAALIIIAVVMALFFNAAADGNGNRQNPVTITAGESLKKPITVERAPPNGTLLLHVVDYSSWQNISDAYVVSVDQPLGQPMLIGSTNSTGYLTFVSLLPGYYEIIVSKNWYINSTFWATVNDNSTARYEVSLQSLLCSAAFRLLETSSGNPIQGVAVVLTSVPPGQNWVNLTGYSGYVVFDSIPFGNYTISFSKSGYVDYGMNVTLSPGVNPVQIVTLASQGGTVPGGAIEVLPILTVVGILGLVGVTSMLVVARRHSQIGHRTASQQWQTDTIPEKVEEQERPVSPVSGRPTRVCTYCGTTIETNKGDFCPNCGANTLAEGAATPIASEGKRVPRTMGRCMVCNLEMNKDEEALWCPFCGNQAHKAHMLEWLHVKNYCPMCHRQLDEHNYR